MEYDFETRLLELLWEGKITSKSLQTLAGKGYFFIDREEKSDEELIRYFESLPFADYKNFADCVAKNKDKDNPNAYCAFIARKTGEIKTLSTNAFRVHMLSWMGQVVVRGIPETRYYLRIKTADGIRSFRLNGNPLHESPLAAEDEGKIHKRWFTFEGKVAPLTTYNPNKRIPAVFTMIDKGLVDMTEEKDPEGAKILSLKFSGRKIHGKWRIVQEEKGAEMWTLEHLMEVLAKATFVLQKHYGEKVNTHYDIRVSEGFEFNIYGNPSELKTGSNYKAVKKEIKNVKALKDQWMNIDKPHTFRLVGPLATYVDPIDKGSVDVIEHSENFVSMKLYGSKIKGYFVYRKTPKGEGIFEHSRLPKPQSLVEGDPNKSAFDPFRQEQKKGWDYYWLYLYDMRMFSRCVSDVKEYLPDISFPDYILQALVCLYPRPGTLPGARVAKIKVTRDTSLGTVTSWIKSQKLHTWQGTLIRHERKAESCCTEELSVPEGDPLVPEYWKVRADHYLIKKVVEPKAEDLRKAEMDKIDEMIKTIEGKMSKSPEDMELDRKLKQKKLELIESWLKANP